MDIIGFILLFTILSLMSGTYVSIFLDLLGVYEIGGKSTTWKHRLIGIAVGLFVCYLWYLLFSSAPFDLSMK